MRTSLLAITLTACLGAPQVGACGLDGTLNNPFTTAYPGSLSVALNTQNAIGNGQLQPLPALDRELANLRLLTRLDQLRARLEDAGLNGDFALLVVDTGHWARFEGKQAKVRMLPHSGPLIYDPILLASEAVLSALLEGRLSISEAEQAGLLRWSGRGSARINAVLTALKADA